MRLLSEREIRAVASYGDLIPAVERSFAALARGDAQLPAVMHFDFPDVQGETHVKGAHLRGSPCFVVKVAQGFYRNADKGLPVGSGLVLAFSATTGEPQAVLLDNGYLTDLRTGAAGAVAAKYLSRPQLNKVAVIGAGVQARCQLRALAFVRQLPRTDVWSRTPERAHALVQELAEPMQGLLRAVPDIEAAVADADLVVTVTPTRVPVLRAEWLSPGVHINAIGSDTPHKHELDNEVLRRADVVVADRLDQCRDSGEIHHALAAGMLQLDDIAGELGDIVLGRIAGRTSDDQITVCDMTGVGVQDAAAAEIVLDALDGRNAGTEVPL